MNTLKVEQKMAALVVPLLLAGVLGVSVVSAHEKGQWKESLSEEQKAALMEARELRKDGDIEGAKALLVEHDIERPERVHKKGGKHSEMRAAIHAAIESNDYDAFTEAVANTPFADIVTEETFELLKETYELRQDGDYAGARELRQEAGLGHGKHHSER